MARRPASAVVRPVIESPSAPTVAAHADALVSLLPDAVDGGGSIGTMLRYARSAGRSRDATTISCKRHG